MTRLIRMHLFAALAALALASAGPAQASSVPFTGSLTIQIGSMLSPISIAGSGTATVNGSGSSHPISQLTIPAGAFATVFKASVSTSFFDELQLSLSNRTIGVQSPGTCTANHPNVSCPGGNLAGFGGLTASLMLSGGANLNIPVSIVGSGSTVSAAIGPFSLRVSGAGWTTGTARILNPDAGTTQTVSGTRNTSGGIATASLTLVTPVQVFTSVTGFTPSFASISLHFVPEPGTLLLLGSGVAGLALYAARWRSRAG